jgi:hypothetical protein
VIFVFWQSRIPLSRRSSNRNRSKAGEEEAEVVVVVVVVVVEGERGREEMKETRATTETTDSERGHAPTHALHSAGLARG